MRCAEAKGGGGFKRRTLEKKTRAEPGGLDHGEDQAGGKIKRAKKRATTLKRKRRTEAKGKKTRCEKNKMLSPAHGKSRRKAKARGEKEHRNGTREKRSASLGLGDERKPSGAARKKCRWWRKCRRGRTKKRGGRKKKHYKTRPKIPAESHARKVSIKREKTMKKTEKSAITCGLNAGRFVLVRSRRTGRSKE